MKAWGSGGIARPFLNSALVGGELLASRPYRFTSWKRTHSIHCIGGWVSLRAGLDAVDKRKILHCRESNPDLPARSLSLYSQLSRLPKLLLTYKFSFLWEGTGTTYRCIPSERNLLIWNMSKNRLGSYCAFRELSEKQQTGHALEIIKHRKKKASDFNLVHACFYI
jgi:hypothetical protein